MLSNEELADKMLFFRGTHGFTQEKFAHLVGISPATINQIETKKQKPTAKTKVKIIKFMEEYEDDVETNNE